MKAGAAQGSQSMEPMANNSVRLITRLATGLIVIGLAVGFLSLLVMTAPQASVSDEAKPARSVIVLESTRRPVRRQFEGYGVADSLHHADVPARVTSTVIELPETSRAGNPVATGQLLVRLDDSDFIQEREIARQQVADIESQLASLALEQQAADDRLALSEEEVAIAQRDFERIQAAAARDAAPPREVDQLRQALIARQSSLITAQQQADQLRTQRSQLIARQGREEANLAIAQQRIDRCRITSPLDGYIESVDVKIGESLVSGSRVARVVDPTLMEVPLRLSAAVRRELGVGDAVALFATGSNDQTWIGAVSRIAPEDDPTTRTTTVYVELEQELDGDSYLAPGMFLRGQVESEVGVDSWVVPRRSVLNDRVLLVRDGRIQSIPVQVSHAVRLEVAETGLPDRDWLVLGSPLAPGDQVVVTPTRSLTDGLPVFSVPSHEAFAALEPDEDRSP